MSSDTTTTITPRPVLLSDIGSDVFTAMAAKWPSSIVARSQVGVFSGGMLHPRTMANLDSRGEGPDELIRMGRHRGYPVDSLIRWMRARAFRREVRQ